MASLYQASAPAFTRMLTNLVGFLEKAEANAKARGFDPEVLLTQRLAPDMAPLLRQCQMASDSAKGCMARLAGVDVPSMPDTETNLAEIKQRLRRTIDFIEGTPAASVDGQENREVVLKFPNGQLTFTGFDYLTKFALPNFYFHATTAYAILRHNGVDVGKMDYLGKIA